MSTPDTPNLNQNPQPPQNSGVNVERLGEIVAQEGRGASGIEASFKRAAQSDVLNPQETVFLQNSENYAQVLEQIALARSAAALDYLTRIITLERSVEQTGQILADQSLAKALSAAYEKDSEASAINQLAATSPDLKDELTKQISEKLGDERDSEEVKGEGQNFQKEETQEEQKESAEKENLSQQEDTQKNIEENIENQAKSSEQGDGQQEQGEKQVYSESGIQNDGSYSGQSQYDQPTNPKTGRQRYIDPATGKYVDQDPANRSSNQQQHTEAINPQTGKARYIDPVTGKYVDQDPATFGKQKQFDDPIDPETGKARFVDPQNGKYVNEDPATFGKQEQHDEPINPATGRQRYIDPATGKYVDQDPATYDPNKSNQEEPGQDQEQNQQSVKDDELSTDGDSSEKEREEVVKESKGVESDGDSQETKKQNEEDSDKQNEGSQSETDKKPDSQSDSTEPKSQEKLETTSTQPSSLAPPAQVKTLGSAPVSSAGVQESPSSDSTASAPAGSSSISAKTLSASDKSESKPTTGDSSAKQTLGSKLNRFSSSLNNARQVASDPKRFAQQKAKQAAQKAMRRVAQQAISWASGAILPILPWILIALAVLSFVLTMLGGLLVAVYCYTEELEDYGSYQIRNTIEYALTRDNAYLINEGAAQTARVIGADGFVRKQVGVKSEIGKIIENQICEPLTGNSCGVLGGGVGSFATGDYGSANGIVTQAECEAFLQYYPLFEQAGQEYGIDPVILGAIASRETRVGTIAGVGGTTGCDIVGDNGFGIGLMQIDTRYHDFANQNGAFDCLANIRKGAEILRDFQQAFPSVPLRQHLNSYNAGSPCTPGTDDCTTGDDYGSDTLNRAADLQNCLQNRGGVDSADDRGFWRANTPYDVAQVTDFLATSQGLNFLINGGVIKAEAVVANGTYEYGGEKDQLFAYIDEGRLRDEVVNVAVRGTFRQQVNRGVIHPNVVKALVQVIQNNPRLDWVNITSAYRADSNTQHGLGQKIDISRVSIDGQAYRHIDVYNNPNVDSGNGLRVWEELAVMLKGTGILKHIITGGEIYETINSGGQLSGVQLYRDDPIQNRFGGIHADHFDLWFDPQGELGAYQFTLDENCVCGQSGPNFSGDSGDIREAIGSGKLTIAAEQANLTAIEQGRLNPTTVALLERMAGQDQFENINIISLFREPNNDFNRFHNNGGNGIAMDIGSITTNDGVRHSHLALHNNPNPEGVAAWVEFSQFLRSTGVVRQIITDSPFTQALRSTSGFQAGPGQGTPQNLRIAEAPGHKDHFHIDIVPDATLSSNPVEKEERLAANLPYYLQVISGSLVAYAAFGERPANYEDLSEGHLEFLGEVAAERGYSGYEDAGGVNVQAQTALAAMQTAARADGVTLTVGSDYRSLDSQVGTYFRPAAPGITNPIEYFWSENLTPEESNQVQAAYLARAEASAPPGYSRHSTGLAFDFANGGSLIGADSAEYAWLQDNAQTYGFEISYPEDNSDGADFEPWEWIFAGNETYALDTSLESFETEGSGQNQLTASNGACVCTSTNLTEQVGELPQETTDEEGEGSDPNAIEEEPDGGEGDSSNPDNALAPEDRGFLQNAWSLLGLLTLGGVQAEAAVSMRLIEETRAQFPGGPIPDGPDEYDLRVPQFQDNLQGNDELIGYNYYQLRSDYNRQGADQDRLNFHAEVAQLYGYPVVPDGGGIQPEAQTAYNEFIAYTQNVGVSTNGMDFVSEYVSPSAQAQRFYDTDGPGEINGGGIWDLDFDRFAFQIPDRYNQLVGNGLGATQIAATFNSEFILSGTGEWVTVAEAQADDNQARDEFNGQTAYGVVLEFRYTEESGRRYRRFLTAEDLVARRTQVKQAYADRAFYYPPVGFDDRQSGLYFSIGEPFAEVIEDKAEATVDLDDADELLTYDLAQLTAYAQTQAQTLGVDPALLEDTILPSSVRLSGNRVHLFDWITYGALNFGIQLTQPPTVNVQQREVISTLANVQSPYLIDLESQEIITDQDGNAVTNPNYLDPNVDPNGLQARGYADSETLGYYLADNSNGLSQLEQVQIMTFAAYLEQELGVDIDGEPARDADGNVITQNGRTVYPDAIDVAALRTANRVRKDITVAKSNPSSPAVDLSDQSNSPRTQTFNALSAREQQVYTLLDGDFTIITVAQTQPDGTVIYEYEFTNSDGVDIDEEFEESIFERQPLSEDDRERLENGEEPEGDGGERIDFDPDNAREQAAYDFYDPLVNNTDQEQYFEDLQAQTELGPVSRTSGVDGSIQIRGDQEDLVNLNANRYYLSYNPQFDPDANGSEVTPNDPDRNGQTGTATALVYSRSVDCTPGGDSGGELANPLPGGIYTSPFGQRLNPVDGVVHDHNGIDLSTGIPGGGDVVAAESGTVIVNETNEGANPCGYYIIIEHSDSLRTTYCHLVQPSSLAQGDQVSRGQVVGKEGSSGRSTGPHLHFSVSKNVNGNWQKVDPCQNGIDCNSLQKSAGFKPPLR